jgi:hypothetical protein
MTENIRKAAYENIFRFKYGLSKFDQLLTKLKEASHNSNVVLPVQQMNEVEIV